MRFPTLFVGHGSPMHAVTQDPFTDRLAALGKSLGTPKAIVCVSAHWLTAGTYVTAMERPRTLHDFYGFPKALFDVRYDAPGDPAMADRIARTIARPRVQLDQSWGFDHGAWSILRHLYPQANVPVVELSLDMAEPAEFHRALGAKLAFLRDEGVLILGSGNIVHNLRMLRPENDVPEWATRFDRHVANVLEARDFAALDRALESPDGRLSAPTPDHFLPLLYAASASDAGDAMYFDYEGFELGTISLRCVRFGALKES